MKITDPDRFGIRYREITLEIPGYPAVPYKVPLVSNRPSLTTLAMEALAKLDKKPNFTDQATGQGYELRLESWDEETSTAKFRFVND